MICIVVGVRKGKKNVGDKRLRRQDQKERSSLANRVGATSGETEKKRRGLVAGTFKFLRSTGRRK